jgi:quercetin dioxygenase-like cupin family protein
MRAAKLQEMTKGWFVGEFTPTLHATRDVEVAVKHYRAGDAEGAHYHKIAREFTVVVSGTVRLNGQTFNAGDIIVIEPGEAAEFAAVTDAVTTVVKIPGAPNDKYVV